MKFTIYDLRFTIVRDFSAQNDFLSNQQLAVGNGPSK